MWIWEGCIGDGGRFIDRDGEGGIKGGIGIGWDWIGMRCVKVVQVGREGVESVNRRYQLEIGIGGDIDKDGSRFMTRRLQCSPVKY